MGLDENGAIPCCFGHPLDFIQQNRISKSAQAGQKKNFARFANTDATQKHTGLIQNRFASHKFRWG